MDRLKACRDGLDKLDEEVTGELNKFSIDVKHFADYQAKEKIKKIIRQKIGEVT